MRKIETIHWVGEVDGQLRLLDQTLLPTVLEEREYADGDVEGVWEAIHSLRVRGAPAIGIAAAYGVCVGLQTVLEADEETFFIRLNEVLAYLSSSRPTAVNLFWALDRMKASAVEIRKQMRFSQSFDAREIAFRLLEEARQIHEDDRRICHAIGTFGAELLPDGAGVLTHCNAGGLATSEYGTALAVFAKAWENGKKIHVYADETRPLLQGARLTTWEMRQRGIPVTLICDSMAAQVMREGKIQAVVVGADRITANGDTANKIGTYSVACLAHLHQIPFYVAAPKSTFDLTLPTGDLIPIEQRHPREITHGFGSQSAPDGIDVYNPAFDVTPARYIRGIITEKGVISPVTEENIRQLFLD
ncbi:MAG: S-methyl-5-thioribose-1-phosphate isomerase [Planctomycetia bacterium]|nr:S-methyl-5-thioribose-1-phosphate isomerase [Planctomycetia bacterium]